MTKMCKRSRQGETSERKCNKRSNNNYKIKKKKKKTGSAIHKVRQMCPLLLTFNFFPNTRATFYTA